MSTSEALAAWKLFLETTPPNTSVKFQGLAEASLSCSSLSVVCPASTYANVAAWSSTAIGSLKAKYRGIFGVPSRPYIRYGKFFPVNAERLEPLHLVGLGGEPSEGLPLDDVIEREQAPHEYLRRRILAPAVANVRDSESPIDGLTGQEDGPLVLGGELLLDEGADFATLVSGAFANGGDVWQRLLSGPPASAWRRGRASARVAAPPRHDDERGPSGTPDSENVSRFRLS